MPIDTSTWEQAAERESTATKILDYLRENQSEAYTTNELVAEIVPEETDDEGVVAYYRAVLEALTHDGRVEKRDVSTDADEADLIPYYRAAADGQSNGPEATEQPTREVPLDRPVRVRMAEKSGAIPVRIEESGPDSDTKTSVDAETPFFVRWYRWYKRTWRRAAREK